MELAWGDSAAPWVRCKMAAPTLLGPMQQIQRERDMETNLVLPLPIPPPLAQTVQQTLGGIQPYRGVMLAKTAGLRFWLGAFVIQPQRILQP
jgi:hypothetical protein